MLEIALSPKCRKSGPLMAGELQLFIPPIEIQFKDGGRVGISGHWYRINVSVPHHTWAVLYLSPPVLAS